MHKWLDKYIMNTYIGAPRKRFTTLRLGASQTMKVISFDNLQDFFEIVGDYEKEQAVSSNRHTPLIYRGHASVDWKLETTLERYAHKERLSAMMYEGVLRKISPAVNSFIGETWQMENAENEYYDASKRFYPNNLNFMAYARHHSFPSPLLDWTQSIYIALFFAFYGASGNDDVAVFSYVDSTGKGKLDEVGAPAITQLGKYFNTHKRHFVQQAIYTIATEHRGAWMYCRHEHAHAYSSSDMQSILTKWVLPISLRDEVIALLDKMNINPFTIYGSEEGLMQSLAYSELLPEIDRKLSRHE